MAASVVLAIAIAFLMTDALANAFLRQHAFESLDGFFEPVQRRFVLTGFTEHVPGVVVTYAEIHPDETAATFRDGWMHTGDVARALGPDGTRVLVNELTMTDPAWLAEPFTTVKRWQQMKDYHVVSYECSEPKWLDELEGLYKKAGLPMVRVSQAAGRAGGAAGPGGRRPWCSDRPSSA